MLDLTPREIGIFVPLGVLTLWMGIYPSSFTQFFGATVDAMVAHHQAALAHGTRWPRRRTTWRTSGPGRLALPHPRALRAR